MGTDALLASFASLLRRYRHAAGLTQEDLAERAHLSVRGITDLERGARRAPHKETVQLLADALALAPPERQSFEAAARRQAGAASEPAQGADGLASVRVIASGRSNLPLTRTSFVGREREQAIVQQLLAATGLVTLIGAGGCGKTRLALQVSAALVPTYPDGVWLVELAALGDPALVPQAVASVLGVREKPSQPLVASLADFMRLKHLLLLLDNCEHLVVACAELADALLRVCPRLTILATSREAVGIPGERAWKVPSLALQDPHASLAPAQACEAVQLFAQRAQAVRSGFALSEQNAGLVAQVCRRLDGIPLAIELAAARLAALSLEQLAARLDDRFRLLTGGSRTALPRQQTLRAALDWSHDLLGVAERVLFRRLSVFAGGWTLEVAEIICAGEGIAADEVLDLLAGLVNKSLVMVEEAGADSRYRLLETVRQYGHEKLVAAGEAEQLRDRHLDWYVVLAERAFAGWWTDQLAWATRIAAELENVWTALAWSKDGGQRQEAGLRIASSIFPFWYLQGFTREGQRWVEDLLEGMDAAAPPIRAGAFIALGVLAFAQGDYERSVALCDAAHRFYAAEGDTRRSAEALGQQAVSMLHLGDLRQARVLGEAGLAAARACQNQWAEGWSLCTLGIYAHLQGDYARANALYTESLALLREVGDAHGVRSQLANLANVARDLGDFERAGRLHRESLTISIDLHDTSGFAECFEGLAVVAAGQGQLERAARLFGAAEMLREAIGRPVEVADRAAHERTVPVVRAILGDEAFASAWAAGREMPLEAAVALALEPGQAPE